MISNFIKRAITGILFVAILVGCILYNSFSFGILFMAISALTIYEFGQLINSRAEGVNVNKTIIMLGGAYLFLAVMGFCIDAADSKIFIPYLLLLLYLMISELYLKKSNPMLNWAYSMLSQLYIGLPFALLNVLAFHTDPEYSSVSYNPILPLSIFIFLWLSDAGRSLPVPRSDGILYRCSRLQDFHSLFAVAALFDDQRAVSEKVKPNA